MMMAVLMFLLEMLVLPVPLYIIINRVKQEHLLVRLELIIPSIAEVLDIMLSLPSVISIRMATFIFWQPMLVGTTHPLPMALSALAKCFSSSKAIARV